MLDDAATKHYPTRVVPPPLFRVKGVLYLGTIADFEREVPGGLATLLAEIADPELRDFIRQPFLPSSWYDVLPAPRLIRAEAAARRSDIPSYLAQRTRYQAERDLGGVYRFALRIASPARVVTFLPKVAAQMFDFARASIETREERRTTFVIRGIPSECGFWLKTSFQIYTRVALERAGAANITTDAALHFDGDTAGHRIERLEVDVRWT